MGDGLGGEGSGVGALGGDGFGALSAAFLAAASSAAFFAAASSAAFFAATAVWLS